MLRPKYSVLNLPVLLVQKLPDIMTKERFGRIEEDPGLTRSNYNWNIPRSSQKKLMVIISRFQEKWDSQNRL